MKSRCCLVCGNDVTGRWPAQTCSMVCRETAYRARRRRHEKRRNPAYHARRKAKQVIREKAKREADPAWQAWRAAVGERKRLEAERRARAPEREQKRERRRMEQEAKQARRLQREAEWAESRRPEYKRARWRWQRLRKERANPELYREAKRARREKQMAPIKALRQLGWVDGFDFVGLGEAPPARYVKPSARRALPGHVVIVDSQGTAVLKKRNSFTRFRANQRRKMIVAAMAELGLLPDQPADSSFGEPCRPQQSASRDHLI
jgi:hypothetical protein